MVGLWIKGPVFYGAQVALRADQRGDSHRFGLSMDGDPRMALVASWRDGTSRRNRARPACGTCGYRPTPCSVRTTRASVNRILVKNGGVCGVDVKNVGVIEVDAVISSASAMQTFCALLSQRDVPSRMSRKVRRAKLSHKGFVLQLGLSNKINVRSHSNSVLPWLGELSQVFLADKNELRWPIYSVPTVTMPELAPPGGSIVEMFPPISQKMTADDWSEEQKEEVAAQAVERLKAMHEIEIAVRRILSPKEFEEASHLYAGALYGLSPLGGPAALFKHRSPVRGLYLAGQTTWPGFGVASAALSGIFAAKALLRDKSL